jgi:hypothetical protein
MRGQQGGHSARAAANDKKMKLAHYSDTITFEARL